MIEGRNTHHNPEGKKNKFLNYYKNHLHNKYEEPTPWRKYRKGYMFRHYKPAFQRMYRNAKLLRAKNNIHSLPL